MTLLSFPGLLPVRILPSDKEDPHEKRTDHIGERHPLLREQACKLSSVSFLEEPQGWLHLRQGELLLPGGVTEEVTMWRMLLRPLCQFLYEEGARTEGGAGQCVRWMRTWTAARTFRCWRSRWTEINSRLNAADALISNQTSVIGVAWKPDVLSEKAKIPSFVSIPWRRRKSAGRRWWDDCLIISTKRKPSSTAWRPMSFRQVPLPRKLKDLPFTWGVHLPKVI